MEYKDKADHLLCHELEQNENNINNDSNRINSNIDISSNLRNINLNINNLNINYDSDTDSDLDIRYNRGNNRRNNRRGRLSSSSSGNNHRRYNSNLFNSDDDIDSLDEEFEALDDDTIQTYPTTKIHDINKLSDENKRCSICLENFKNGDDSIILPCIHIFHSKCINIWMKKNAVCPICKYKINQNNNNNPY